MSEPPVPIGSCLSISDLFQPALLKSVVRRQWSTMAVRTEGVNRWLAEVDLRALVPGGVLLFGSDDRPENPGT